MFVIKHHRLSAFDEYSTEKTYNLAPLRSADHQLLCQNTDYTLSPKGHLQMPVLQDLTRVIVNQGGQDHPCPIWRCIGPKTAGDSLRNKDQTPTEMMHISSIYSIAT